MGRDAINRQLPSGAPDSGAAHAQGRSRDAHRVWDAVVIGAGPAGLTAATYLGRFRRSALVLHDMQSRARWIPRSHNTPGFPTGVGGRELLSRLHHQAEEYRATVRRCRVSSVKPSETGFTIIADETWHHARFVILATGVRDKLPPIAGIEEAIQQGIVRICPICDAYEATDLPIAVLGDGDHGIREAEFLTSFSPRVTLIHLGASLDQERRRRVAAGGIALLEVNRPALRLDPRGLSVEAQSGTARFDICYVALGCTPRGSLVAPLKAALDESGALVVNAHQETSIAGIYAAGDIVRGLNQIVVAAAEGAIAATHIHNRLRLGDAGH